MPTVIFLMVMVGMLLSYMTRVAMQQSASVDMALLSARADLAVRTAMEWVTYKIKTTNTCPASPPDIDNHDITIACSVTAFQEGSATGVDNRFKYDLVIRAESAAGNRASPDYAFRSINMTLMVEQ